MTSTAAIATDALPVRPRTRGECLGGERPCPWLTCQHHLLAGPAATLDDERVLALLDELPDTCTLDVTDRGEQTLLSVAERVLSRSGEPMTRERMRQIETKAMGHLAVLRHRLPALDVPGDTPEPWQWHGRTDVPDGTMGRSDGMDVRRRLYPVAPPTPPSPTAAPSPTATATPPDPAPTAASEPVDAASPTATEPPEAPPPTATTCSHDDCTRPVHPGAIHRNDLCLPHLRGWLASRTAYQRAALAASAPTTTATPASKDSTMATTAHCSVPGCRQPAAPALSVLAAGRGIPCDSRTGCPASPRSRGIEEGRRT